jgi:pimeloyl-ACP methyl ester carboxylesterase
MGKRGCVGALCIQRFGKRVLKSEFLPVDDAAHLPFIEQAEIVNPALVTFLKK